MSTLMNFNIFRRVVPCQSCIFKQIYRMAHVNVRRVHGEERMQLSLTYVFSRNQQSLQTTTKNFCFDRLQNEELEKTLARISGNVSKEINKKSKKKSKDKSTALQENINIDVKLIENGCEVVTSTPNREAWTENSTLIIDETEYTIRVNTPTIKHLSVTSCIMAGFPIYPKLEVEFTDVLKSEFTWFCSCQIQSSAEGSNVDMCKKKLKNNYEWTEVHKGFMYVVKNDMIGLFLKLKVTPISSAGINGDQIEITTEKEVTAGPGICPFETRHLFTSSVCDAGVFRCVSYNLLADVYADSEFSRTKLFPYCPEYALDIDYRRQLFIKEIIGYNADVICLQEVDRKVFNNDLLPALEQENFDGLLKIKSTDVREGCATFFRKSKFRLVESRDIKITEAVFNNPKYTELLKKVCSNEKVKEVMDGRNTILQVTVLESIEDPSKIVVVANTHLYFHPRANHIRVIQGYTSLLHIKGIVEEYIEKGKQTCPLFCGDLNTAPINALTKLITDGHVPSSHSDWFAGGREEFIEGMDLTNDMTLTSACGFPQYTNYVGGFCGCLDYIYIDNKQLEVEQVVPLPSHEEVVLYSALPNIVFPSDHLALVCDLKWTDNAQMDTQ